MSETNGKKAKGKPTSKREEKASAQRAEDIRHLRLLLEQNEARLTTETNVHGEPLTQEQITALSEVIKRQRERLAELMM